MREVSFEIDLWPAVPPMISGTLSKASAALMSGEQGSFISPRYEQLCRTNDDTKDASCGSGATI